MREYNYIQSEQDFQYFLSTINSRLDRAMSLSESEYDRLSDDVDACTEIRIRLGLQKE